MKFIKYASAFLVLTSSSIAAANVTDIYGSNPRGMSLGNATMSGGDGSFAAQSNPASLTEQDGSSVAVSFQMSQLSLKDLSAASTEDSSGLPASPYKASEADPISGNTVGLNLALAESLRLGLTAYMPNGNFGKLMGVAPNEVHYLRSGDAQERPAIYTAAALKFGRLSVGLGTYYTLKAEGSLQMALNNKASAARFNLNMVPVISPYGGLLWSQKTSFGAWSAGAFYRTAQSTKSEIDTYLAVGAVGDETSATLPMSIQTSLVPFYDPELYKIGFNVAAGRIKAYAAAELYRWSEFEAPLISLAGDDIASLTESNERAQLSLNDTYSYKAGLAYLLDDKTQTELRFGLEHHESATEGKAIVGLVDPSRSVIALGAGMNVLEGLLEEGKSAKIDFSYQRSILEDTNVDISDRSVTAGGYTDTLIGGISYGL